MENTDVVYIIILFLHLRNKKTTEAKHVKCRTTLPTIRKSINDNIQSFNVHRQEMQSVHWLTDAPAPYGF